MTNHHTLLTCSELAALVGRSERSIQRYIQQGKLKAIETLVGVRIPSTEAEKFPIQSPVFPIPDRLERPREGDDSCRPLAPATDSVRQEAPKQDTGSDELSPEAVTNRQAAPDHDKKNEHLSTGDDSDRQQAPANDTSRQSTTDVTNSAAVQRQGATTGGRPEPAVATGQIPLEVHLEALKGIQEALRQVDLQRRALEEQRLRVELVERQKLALEVELQKYQFALTEQAESLFEARANQKAAELKVDTPKTSFGQRFRRFFGKPKSQAV
jgi:hypothetical protein